MYRSDCSSTLCVGDVDSKWITVWQAQQFRTWPPSGCWTSVAESVYNQTQARPLLSEFKGRKLLFLGHSLRGVKEDRINTSIRPVCTIWRETKCWRTETFGFAMHLKSHYGRLQSTDRARNTTYCWRPGLLESSGCRLPGQSGLTRRRPITAISRNVVGKKQVHATITKVKWDMNNTLFLTTVAVEPTLVLANICPWPLVPFFQISLKNRELKTTQNTFRDCSVHFFRQPYSK